VGRRGGGERPGAGAEEVVSRPALLDTSFLIDLERETAKGEAGPARRFLPSLRGRPLVISIVTVEELLEGAADEDAALASLQRFSIQGLHLGQARRCALLQRRAARRMGENDAWLVATAESINADVVGADRIAFGRLGARYLRYR
jgi:predicted nucleic acid-binding protein